MDFIKELETSFIPRIKEMIAKEDEHLNMLTERFARKSCFKVKIMKYESKSYLIHLKFRLKEYENYILTHKTI